MDMDIQPPEATKKIDNCKFRTSDDQCCYALNPLRPHLCNKYCVERLYLWLKTAHPELDEVSRLDLIVELTKVELESPA